MAPLTPLGMSPARFLKGYWQKRPLLVRGAFPGFRDPVTPNELAGLACEPDVPSRLVMERGGAKPWQVTLGPLRAARLRRLPPTHWTLLVQGVDRLLPGVAALLEPFRFLPDWRVDDVMISFAPRAGSVGPHADSYDVFLLQGRGRRRWRIDERAEPDFRPGMDLRLLKKFRPQREWMLEPGDMLYLPPGVGHHGVALEDCLTYSIGFRAPDAAELVAAALPVLGRQPALYRDPPLRPAAHPGEISPAALRALRRLMEDGLRRLPDDAFAALAGELLTEPRASSAPDERRVDAAALRAKLARGADFVRAAGTRAAFLRRGPSAVLFVNGRAYPLPRALAFAAPLLGRGTRVPSAALAPRLRNPAFVRLLAALAASGAFRPER